MASNSGCKFSSPCRFYPKCTRGDSCWYFHPKLHNSNQEVDNMYNSGSKHINLDENEGHPASKRRKCSNTVINVNYDNIANNIDNQELRPAQSNSNSNSKYGFILQINCFLQCILSFIFYSKSKDNPFILFSKREIKNDKKISNCCCTLDFLRVCKKWYQISNFLIEYKKQIECLLIDMTFLEFRAPQDIKRFTKMKKAYDLKKMQKQVARWDAGGWDSGDDSDNRISYGYCDGGIENDIQDCYDKIANRFGDFLKVLKIEYHYSHIQRRDLTLSIESNSPFYQLKQLYTYGISMNCNIISIKSSLFPKLEYFSIEKPNMKDENDDIMDNVCPGMKEFCMDECGIDETEMMVIESCPRTVTKYDIDCKFYHDR